MASGDPTAEDLGVFTISDGTLVTAINGLTNFHPLLSGSSIHLIPAGEGQVNLVRIDIAGTG